MSLITRPGEASAADGPGPRRASAAAPGGAPGGGGPARPATSAGQLGAARGWRQWRVPLAIIVLVLLAGTAVALLQPAPGIPGYLSPDNKAGDGTHALADILGQGGHHVRAEDTVAAAVAAASAHSTLVITSPYLLTGKELAELGRTPASLLIVEPDETTLTALAPRITLAGGGPVEPLLPACGLRAATLAGPADLGGAGLSVRPGPAAVTQCYIDLGVATLVQYRSGGRLITVLSTGTPLTDAYLAREGNAALSINLLSSGRDVVWLVPSAETSSGAGSGRRPLTSLLPLAVYLIAIQLAVALLLTVMWRARRLGPLITERLPVVVRASETVEGHARLYRSRRARGQAAGALRAAALARMTPGIGLPPAAAPGAVTAALAARSARDESQIGDLLYGPAPGSDEALVTLASDLDDLEEEARR